MCVCFYFCSCAHALKETDRIYGAQPRCKLDLGGLWGSVAPGQGLAVDNRHRAGQTFFGAHRPKAWRDGSRESWDWRRYPGERACALLSVSEDKRHSGRQDSSFLKMFLLHFSLPYHGTTIYFLRTSQSQRESHLGWGKSQDRSGHSVTAGLMVAGRGPWCSIP